MVLAILLQAPLGSSPVTPPGCSCLWGYSYPWLSSFTSNSGLFQSQAAVLPLIDGGSCFLSCGPQSLTRLVVPDALFGLVRSFLSPGYKSSTDFTYYSGATKVSFDPVFRFCFPLGVPAKVPGVSSGSNWSNWL